LGGKKTPMLEFLRKFKEATTQLQVIGEKMEDNYNFGSLTIPMWG
jgi:hypothetical protein